MSKSVLVVNTPKCCFDCDLWTDDKRCFRCIVADKKYEDNSIRQEWCPLIHFPQTKLLREMPKDVMMMRKSKRDYVIHRVDVDNAYAMGWNDCIEYLMTGKDADEELNDLLGEILGETE